MKKVFFAFLMAMLAIFPIGCDQNNNNASETNNHNEDKNNQKEIEIYTTIYPLTDFTKKIGGKYVHVEIVYPPNVEAHTYEPTLKTLEAIAKADLFIYTGAGIEGFADKAEKTLKDGNVKIVKAAEGIPLLSASEDEHDHESGEEEHSHHEEDSDHEEEHGNQNEEEHDHAHGDVDPHVWLDPNRAITLAENIKNALTEAAPDQKEYFEQNFAQLKQDLEELDQSFQETIKKSKTKYILVAHAAYGYWEDRYDIEQIPISGLSPTDEPSQKQLVKIIELSKKHHLKHVIFEQNVSEKVAKIIQQEIGAKSLTLHNLESVSETDLNNNEDYFSIMKRNLETLSEALN
ncbi:metal ABC transporter substrate-binding protein [Aeribacillus sp. FSL W8-0870]|uniref:metal ABC transporter substrate-binding protein n=1 Tax=Aeribacillus sp. FSL W8-0870 TaxID=2954706 RepID=UPI0030CD4E2C